MIVWGRMIVILGGVDDRDRKIDREVSQKRGDEESKVVKWNRPSC